MRLQGLDEEDEDDREEIAFDGVALDGLRYYAYDIVPAMIGQTRLFI